MIKPPLIAGLGEIMQLAYVPADINAAVAYWTKVMGVGPFFRREHVKLEGTQYLGRPVDIDFSMLLGYWGDIQIELIEQHNDAPSIYKKWRDEGRDGLHHVCLLVEDFAAAHAKCIAVGAQILQEARVPGGGEVIYVDAGAAGPMVEVLKPTPRGLESFAFMRDAARAWDGSQPVRSAG
ncbi:MAG: hypothetical protein EPO08_14165 [Rhodospirillaceae bacterium]|nr:MAG: hypothetical protein EPO08_14165 [Rhodospirillaceae bacterium]